MEKIARNSQFIGEPHHIELRTREVYMKLV